MIDPADLILTTVDNPHNPHEQYELWRRWDIDNGYDTESLIARVADIPTEIDDTNSLVMDLYANQAIMEILENDDTHTYKLI